MNENTIDQILKREQERAESDKLNDKIKQAGARKADIYLTKDEENKRLAEELSGPIEDTDFKALLQEQLLLKETRTKAISFIDPEFDNFIDPAPGSLLIMPIITGGGKSTICALAAINYLKLKKKVLIISNEENSADVVARMACAELGYSFIEYKRKKSNLSDIQVANIYKKFKEYQDSKTLTVIGASYKNNSKHVTSYQGVKNILEHANDYDVVLIDYYQKIKIDTDNPEAKPWDAQEKLADYLDIRKHTIGCPIIMWAQIKPNSGKTNLGPEERAKGRKSIYEVATDIFEYIIIPEGLNKLYCWKNRFDGEVNYKALEIAWNGKTIKPVHQGTIAYATAQASLLSVANPNASNIPTHTNTKAQASSDDSVDPLHPESCLIIESETPIADDERNADARIEITGGNPFLDKLRQRQS